VALPTPPFRLEVLRATLPLVMVETSHLLAALSGVGLVLVAPALDRRLFAAWWWCAALLGAGAASSLLKGYDFEEAILLGLFLLALMPARRHFHSRALLRDQPYSPAWIVTLVVVLASAIWLGFFAHKSVDYVPELWWTFGYDAEASRGLRAVAGALVLVALVAAAHLRPPTPEPDPRLPAGE
jgi:phosphatidylglycerol lysyltransferase